MLRYRDWIGTRRRRPPVPAEASSCAVGMNRFWPSRRRLRTLGDPELSAKFMSESSAEWDGAAGGSAAGGEAVAARARGSARCFVVSRDRVVTRLPLPVEPRRRVSASEQGPKPYPPRGGSAQFSNQRVSLGPPCSRMELSP